MADKPKTDPRYHVTVEYKPGEADPAELLIKAGSQKFTLKKGDNEVPIGLYHALGADPKLCELIGAGVIRPVCRNHKFETVHADDVAELRAIGHWVSAGDEHPEKKHCRYCGHTRESAADAERLAQDAKHQEKLAAEKAERDAALKHHAECVALAVKGDHSGAKKLAVEYSKAKIAPAQAKG